jgi:hypothetical protein
MLLQPLTHSAQHLKRKVEVVAKLTESPQAYQISE